MKRMRAFYIAKQQTISDSATDIWDVRGTEPISALEIEIEATNGATSCQNHSIHDDISAIELTDGSDTLFSLTGIEAQALNFYELRRMPKRTLTEVGGATQKERFWIFFGRYLGDERFYLTPAQFANLQLKITHALTVSATAGFATGTGKVSVIAHAFVDPPPAADGYMMAKRIKSWSSAASGDEDTYLPLDYPVRHLLLRAFESGTAMDATITNVKISCDTDRYVALNHSPLWVRDMNALRFGLCEVHKTLKAADGDTIYAEMGYVEDAIANSLQDLDLASFDAVSTDQLTLQVLKFTTSPSIAKETADVSIDALIRGYAPYNTLSLLHQDPMDPGAWFEPRAWSSVKVSCTQGNAGATCALIVQQPRRA